MRIAPRSSLTLLCFRLRRPRGNGRTAGLQPAVTYAAPVPVIENVSPISAVSAATAPVNEYATPHFSSAVKYVDHEAFILQRCHEWRNESLYTVPPEVGPQNLDFDVSEFPRSSPNPVASVFGDCEIIQRAAVRRGYPVMKSRFFNFDDDIHDQPENESRMRFNEFHPDF